MPPSIDEQNLIRKLVTTGHLNMPERRCLPGGRAKARLILDAIEELLHSGRWFPVGVRVEDDYTGGLIELTGEGSSRIHWKSQVSFSQYEFDGIEEFETPQQAATKFLLTHFADQIDGIPIDWQA